MRKTLVALVLTVFCCFCFCFCFCGCGDDSSSESTETIQAGKTARLILHLDFGNSSEERAKASDTSFVAEAQQKKVKWVSGWLTSTTHPEKIRIDFGNDSPRQAEFIVEPGEYDLWVGAYTSFGERGEYTFCLFKGKKNVILQSGENSESIALKLSTFQPVVLVLPEATESEVKMKGKCFWSEPPSAEEFNSCFFYFTETKVVGDIPLNATEIKVCFKDKIYSIAPEKMINSLLFDESIIVLSEYPFITAATAVLNVGILDNKVVAGTSNLDVLKFQTLENANVDHLHIALNGTESDIEEVTLIADNEIIGKSSIAHGHACFYFLNQSLIISKGTIFTLLADIPISANSENKFSFEVRTVDNPDLCPLKQVGPEFTTIQRGTLLVETAWNPLSTIVLAGSTNNVFTSIRLITEGEDVGLDSLTLRISGVVGEYHDVANVAIYDGAKLLAQAAIPSTGYYTFNFSKGNLQILEGVQNAKVLTIKADMATIDPVVDNAPGTSGADVKITLSDIKATGMISNISPDISSLSVESSPMILRSSRPIVECSSPWNSLGTATALTNGNICLFAFKVFVDASGGEVLLNKIGLKFLSDSSIKISNITIKDQNDDIVNYGSPVCESESCMCGFSLNNPDYDVSRGEESIEIPSGQSKTFYVWATVIGAKTGSSISTTLLGDNTCDTAGTAREMAMKANFVWSDNYQQKSLTDAPSCSQWYNGHLVPGLRELPYIIFY